MEKEIEVEVIEMNVPSDAVVFENQRQRAKSTAFTFDYPDGKQGILTITKRTNQAWIPMKDIRRVTIVFNNFREAKK